LKLRSVRSIVIAPARTGSDSSSRIAVINTDHTNSGIRCILRPGDRMLTIVVMKLTAPRIDPAPLRWREKIARSMEGPECAVALDKGGYTVQPVPLPASTSEEETSSIKAGGRSQNEILLRRGNAMSGAPIIRGTNQLPNPPIMKGMTKKKIMTNLCAVTITL